MSTKGKLIAAAATIAVVVVGVVVAQGVYTLGEGLMVAAFAVFAIVLLGNTGVSFGSGGGGGWFGDDGCGGGGCGGD